MRSKIGIVLMTYGSATTAANVRPYFEHIYKNPSRELIADFQHRYKLVGGSPLVAITKRQASLLQKRLGEKYVVRAGMRHSAPFISEAVAACKKAGATELRGIILSPQFSSFIMEGYKRDFSGAAAENGFTEYSVHGPWEKEPAFIKLLAKRVKEKLKKLPKDTPVIFTTHSLPKRVVEKDPKYLKQLSSTINAVRKQLPKIRWYAGYQSAGHTPEEWLKPDLVDILRDLRRKTSDVLIVPIQFLADHLEILFDLDVAAKAQCEEFGIRYNRIELPNTDPLFIETLRALAKKAAVRPQNK
jgi:ferrochelatase